MKKLGGSTVPSSSLSCTRRRLLTMLLAASAGLSLVVVDSTRPQQVAAQGIIYAVMDNGDLKWNRHDGRDDGSFRWATDTGKVVGTGWNVKHVFSD